MFSVVQAKAKIKVFGRQILNTSKQKYGNRPIAHNMVKMNVFWLWYVKHRNNDWFINVHLGKTFYKYWRLKQWTHYGIFSSLKNKSRNKQIRKPLVETRIVNSCWQRLARKPLPENWSSSYSHVINKYERYSRLNLKCPILIHDGRLYASLKI